MSATMQGIGGGLGWSLLPPLMAQIAADLHISHAMGGLCWGAAPLGIALAAPFGGAAVDRYGARRVAGLAMLAGAAACALRALAVGPWSLALVMFLFGLHIGFVAPAIPKALAGHVPLNRVARANGLALLGYTFGTALTVLFARTHLVPWLGGWREAMLVAAAAMAVVGVLWLVLIEDRIAFAKHAKISQVLALARDTQLLRVAAMHFLLFGGYLALLGMLPRALYESGVPLTGIGLAVAGWLFAAGMANWLGPVLSDRFKLRRPFLLVGAVVAAGGLAVLAAMPDGNVLVPLIIAALGGGIVAPLILSLPLELPSIGPARAGAALGLLMLVGQAGGFLLPLLTGSVAGGSGIGAAIGVVAVVHLAIVIPAWGIREPHRTKDLATDVRPGATSAKTASPAQLVA